MWIRDRSRQGLAENRAPSGCRVRHCAEPPSGAATRCAQWRYRAPPEARCDLLLRLRGRPPACHRRGRSPPNQLTRTTPMATLGRRDALGHSGPEGRGRRSTSSKTAVTAGNPAGPNLPALSRKRPTDFNISDGQAGSPPHNARPTWCGSATEADKGKRKTSPQRGAGYVIVLEPPTGAATRCAQWRYRAPSGSAMRSAPGYEAGRRRAIGVVAALPINPRVTTPMVRRWSAGTHWRHSGPEGRG